MSLRHFAKQCPQRNNVILYSTFQKRNKKEKSMTEMLKCIRTNNVNNRFSLYIPKLRRIFLPIRISEKGTKI